MGDEVMLFFEPGATVRISGNAPGFDIVAPRAGTYKGVALFAHRDNTESFDIAGSGLFDIQGTMYMAGGHLEMDGNVDRRIGKIIVNTLLFRGTGRYLITGQGFFEGNTVTAFLVK